METLIKEVTAEVTISETTVNVYCSHAGDQHIDRYSTYAGPQSHQW